MRRNIMRKKKRISAVIIVLLTLLILLSAAVAIFVKRAAPPGEEWISYENDRVISEIDRQLAGLDIEKIVEEKAPYVVETGIEDIQKSVAEGLISYREITAVCLYRIRTMDQTDRGLNSVISVNPHAMEEAARRDLALENMPELSSGIYGIPVMLKDNINTVDMPVSAGTVAFSDYYPPVDAGIVTALKDRGAIILGKTNLSELSNYMSSLMPAGYSGRKGQTVNPFGPLKRSASGSSSGSAVAVTANLVPVSMGTETDGSIVAPSAANSVVGYKPSRKLVPDDGIVPLVKALDTPGPIAKCVKDAAAVCHAVTGETLSEDYQGDALKGKRVGLLGYEYNDKKMLAMLRDYLQSAGAEVVDVNPDFKGIILFRNISLSFRTDFEEYAETYGLPIRTLDDLLAFNRQDPERRMRYGQDWLEGAAGTQQQDPAEIGESIQNAEKALTALFDENRLDALVFLNSSGSTAPAAAGWPELTVPMGQDRKGAPQGATFTARYGEDEALLNMGYGFETHVRGRMVP